MYKQTTTIVLVQYYMEMPSESCAIGIGRWPKMNANKDRNSSSQQVLLLPTAIGLAVIVAFVVHIAAGIVQSLADPELYLALANGLPPFVVGVAIGIVFGVTGVILILDDTEEGPSE